VYVGDGGGAEYAYNGLGDRLTENAPIEPGSAVWDTTYYTLDLNTGLTQVLKTSNQSSIITYAYGLGRISQHDLLESTTQEYFLGDALGSVRQMTDQAGGLTFTQSYDPYGVVTYTDGTSQTDYGFTGEQYSVETQMLYLRARYYNPADARFMSRDTWAGDVNNPLSLNRWNYVNGNPVNYIDPTGHIEEGQARDAFGIMTRLKSNYNASIVVDWGYTNNGVLIGLLPIRPDLLALYGYDCVKWEKGLWELDQLSATESAYNKIRDRLNVPESVVARILGPTSLRRVDQIQSWFVDNPVADASPSGLIRLSAKAFKTNSLPREWFILHELGRIFDFQGSGGSYKSQKFLEEFQQGPCVWSWCPYNPSDDPYTTPYGLTSVLEDFADTFAVTIFFNQKYGDLQSQKRLDLMNSLLNDAVNGN
jgi:RHS repeat-associated protein